MSTATKMSRRPSKYFVDNKNGNCRLCDKPDPSDSHMVQCDECDRWFHLTCAKLTKLPTAEEEFMCIKCSADRAKAQDEAGPSGGEKGDRKEKKAKTAEPEVTTIAELVAALTVGNKVNTNHLLRMSLNDLPYFDGNPRDWPAFDKAFRETTEAANFNDLENMNRLQRCLKGDALRNVKALFFDPENVDIIIERLRTLFGRSEQVYQELLREVQRKADPNRIPDLSIALENLVANIKTLNKPSYLSDHRLINELASKLPQDKQLKWLRITDELEEQREMPTLEHFSTWLANIASELRRLPKAIDRKPLHLHDTTKPAKNVSPKHERNIKPKKERKACPNCKGSHNILNCDQFKSKTPAERYEAIKKEKLCSGCLRSNGHEEKTCWFARECGINGCKERHHRLVHVSTEGLINCHHTGSKVYYQIIPVELRNDDKKIKTYAFLDTGASSTLIDAATANQLNLKGAVDPITLTWTQNLSVQDDTSQRVQCKIKGQASQKEYSLQGARTVKNLKLPTQTIDSAYLLEKYPHLQGIKLMTFHNARPTVLIGLNNAHLMAPINQRYSSNDTPRAMETKLGWTVFGQEVLHNESVEHIMIHREEENMNKLIKSYFSIENFGVKITKPLLTREQTRVNNIVQETLKKKEDRYEIGLLWRKDNVVLPPSYKNAFNRLQFLERQLSKEKGLQEWAKTTFSEYQKKGYLRKLSPEEALTKTPTTFYLPHFIVVNKNKPIPKPRLVFDAAATVNGISLNSELMSGPDINAPLFGVLLRFREGGICVTGDIKEMFHQVQIRKEDQEAQRILWRDCENREPDTYVMQVMTFGATCSPACAQIVKNHNAEQHKQTHPKALNAITRQHYVDDYLDSFMSIEEAIDTVNQVINVHAKGGFEIRNFKSNSKELLQTIPDDRKSSTSTVVTLEEKESNVEKVLGIYWNTDTDQIGFQVNFNGWDHARTPTKRQALSYVMRVYDPLGLISHITIHGRLLTRSINQAMKDWDIPIPEALQPQWHEWREMALKAKVINIPRPVMQHPTKTVELHTFVDASEEAFAACVYVRTRCEGENVVRFLVGKALVAPTPIISIPRLELQAAVLGARLTDAVKKELRLNVEKTTYWSDSQTVLSWINSVNRKYHQFVAIRISEILDSSTMSEWRWVPTKQNPADIATKKVADDTPWLKGPTFLQQDETTWPVSRATYSTKEEERVFAFHQEAVSIIDEDRYSYWDKLVKHLTYLKKFVNYLQNKDGFKSEINLRDVEQG
ncbi:uncharacterized protein LOC131293502 [Anopheles ziemanni]|uniref:uncharacterized protein LOC131264328 n=1 Tax=Anopheles coustani TaxID=139045 RepID=UPI002659D658|nr:uncharacterized protein LOC131264328 [Anopheles coustani]XP_058177561.1 uncharacterized protein LOC131293502 [Anopheles ziemanni]